MNVQVNDTTCMQFESFTQGGVRFLTAESPEALIHSTAMWGGGKGWDFEGLFFSFGHFKF